MRIHTRSNVESANGIEAGRLAEAALAECVPDGVQPRAKLRVAIARNTLMRECDALLTFVINAKVLFYCGVGDKVVHNTAYVLLYIRYSNIAAWAGARPNR